jgi:hypothetical protein
MGPPQVWGRRRSLPDAGVYRWLAGISVRSRNQAGHYRPRSEPGAGDWPLVATSALARWRARPRGVGAGFGADASPHFVIASWPSGGHQVGVPSRGRDDPVDRFLVTHASQFPFALGLRCAPGVCSHCCGTLGRPGWSAQGSGYRGDSFARCSNSQRPTRSRASLL